MLPEVLIAHLGDMANSNGSSTSAVEISLLVPCDESERDGYVHLGKASQPVRALIVDDFDSKSPRGKWFRSQVSATDWRFISAILEFRRAGLEQNQVVLDKAFEELRKIADQPESARVVLVTKELAQALARPRNAMEVLPQAVSNALQNTQLVLWWPEKEQSFALSIYCSNPATAVLARALIGTKALRVCPQCGGMFLPNPPQQQYCDDRCGSAYRTARSRSKKKVEATTEWHFYDKWNAQFVLTPTIAEVTESFRNWFQSSKKSLRRQKRHGL